VTLRAHAVYMAGVIVVGLLLNLVVMVLLEAA
jgi:hypothetical protein